MWEDGHLNTPLKPSLGGEAKKKKKKKNSGNVTLWVVRTIPALRFRAVWELSRRIDKSFYLVAIR